VAQIKIANMTKRYQGTTVVKSLDLEIRDKEFLVLLGPSGCGKTTTLNVIAGLEDISEGDIYFDDARVNDVPPHKRNIAMVFQSYALYPQKTVYENIGFGLRLMKTPGEEIDRRVRAAAERLEIAHLLERRPAQLSGGQRQRVALGRAIVRQPSVFLMDEPLSNLDAALRVTTRTLIKQLHNSMGATFVYVTHDQAEAMTLADRIVVMNQGAIQQIGTPDDIYHRPANLFVATFLGTPQMNLIEGTLSWSAGQPVFTRDGLVLRLRDMKGFASGSDEIPVVLGIRPEDVALAAPETADEPQLACEATMVSSLGSEKYINTAIAGRDLTFRVGKDVAVSPGDRLKLSVPGARVHLFDRGTGATLGNA